MAYRRDIEQKGEPSQEGPSGAQGDLPSDHIFGRRLVAVGLEDVFYEPFKFPQEKHINLGNLQRMMLHVLQRELVEEVGRIKETANVD